MYCTILSVYSLRKQCGGKEMPIFTPCTRLKLMLQNFKALPLSLSSLLRDPPALRARAKISKTHCNMPPEFRTAHSLLHTNPISRCSQVHSATRPK